MLALARTCRPLGCGAALMLCGALPIAFATELPSRAVLAGPVEFAGPRTCPLPRPQVDLADLDGGFPDLLSQSTTAVVMRSNLGALSFGPEQSIPLAPSGALGAYVAADLNGDGRRDLAGLTSTALLAIRLGTGGGAFGPVASVPLPAAGNGLTVADLDGDTVPDLAVSHADSGKISVWIGNGDGTFDPPVLYTTSMPPGYGYGSSRFEDIVAGRFNGDALPDLAVLDHYPRRTVAVMLNAGGGTFGAAVHSPSVSGFHAHLAAGDLDGDGLDDLVVGAEPPKIGVLRDLGAGVFASVDSITRLGSTEPVRPALADADGDGRLDLLCTYTLSGVDRDRNYLGIWRGAGDGHFGERSDLQVGVSGRDVAAADLDGDGALDVVAATQCAAVSGSTCLPGVSTAWVFEGLGSGLMSGYHTTFSGTVCDPVPVQGCAIEPWSLAVVRAGAPSDVLIESGGHTLWRRNHGAGTFDPPVDVLAIPCRKAPDLDGDGDDELMSTTGDSVAILRTIGNAAWASPVWYAGGRLFAFADYDGDGRLDLGVTAPDGRLHVRAGDGAGGFGAMTPTGLVIPPGANASFDVGDTDGDGRAEVLYSEDRSDPDSLFVIALPGGIPDTLAVIEVPCTDNGVLRCARARPKLARAGPGALPSLYVMTGSAFCDCPGLVLSYRRQPDGTYAEVSRFTTGRDPLTLEVADFDLDGVDEAIFTYGNDCCHAGVIVYHGEPAGALGGAYVVYPGAYPVTAFGARIDDDSRPDLVTDLRHYGRFGFVLNRSEPVLPTPALISLVSLRAEAGLVRLEGFGAEGAGRTARVERRTVRSSWTALATLFGDGSGHFRFDDRTVEAGERYGYRLVSTEAGAEPGAESWIDVPAPFEFGVGSVLPNPIAHSGRLSFVLPAVRAVRLEVVDLLGRRRARRVEPSVAAGPHTWPVPGADALESGVYLLRFESAGRVSTRRFAVIR